MRKKNKTRRAIAYHEAGHAVVSLHYCAIVADVCLGPKPMSRAWPPTPPALHVAGYAAEEILRVGMLGKVPSIIPLQDMCSSKDLENFIAGAGMDLQEINQISPDRYKIFARGMLLMMTPIWQEAVAILKHHWRAVSLIAEELLICRTMPGDRARELFEGCKA